MSAQLSQGSAVAIGSTYGAVKTMSAISNATSAVATLESSHGVIVGDVIELTSGWDLLDKRMARCSAVSTNDITLESIDTSSTTKYPAGEGIGTIREVTAFTTITQIAEWNVEATTVEFVDITTLANQVRREIPGLESAPKVTGQFYFDIALTWIATVLAISDLNSLNAMRITTPGGNKIYGNGYWKLSRTPQLAIGQAIKQALNATLVSWPTAYAS